MGDLSMASLGNEEKKMKNAELEDEYAVKQYEKQCDLLLGEIKLEWDADCEVGILESIYSNLIFFIAVTLVLLISFMLMLPFNLMQWFDEKVVLKTN